MLNSVNNLLNIKDLSVSVIEEDQKVDDVQNEKVILKDFSLNVNKGEVHVLMGTNGSGKSTLANTLMGHPKYKVNGGTVKYLGDDLIAMLPEERAKKGIFLAFQYPTTIQGLSVGSFLRAIVKSVSDRDVPIREFRNNLNEIMQRLEIPKKFLARSLNEGFSGGEKKRLEILQMNLLNPKLIMLDETDSGLDVDALKLVFENINKKATNETGIIIITHYNRVLRYVKPTHVHILKDGKIIKSGGQELSDLIEENGFEAVLKD